MKLKPLIAFLLFIACSSLLFAQQNTFNWGDTVFVKGSIHPIRVEYGLDDCGITLASKDTIRMVSNFMKANPLLKIEIDCHTDPRGNEVHNMRLSQARAQAIVDYIISQGIDSARLIAKGWGFHKTLPGCSPVDIAKMKNNEEKEAAYQADRRTEVKIAAPDSANIFQWSDVKFMKYSLRRVSFTYELDRAQLRSDSDSENKLKTDTVVQFLKLHPYLMIGVYVHTDSRASDKHDMMLSQARAQTVTDKLVEHGIAPTRIIAKGWEFHKPLISQKKIDAMKTQEEKEAAYAMDRRTEIVILGIRK